MPQTNENDPNYDWAQKHMADFERYLEEQCQPYFKDVTAEDSSKFMAPMWWSVGYVIQRGLADDQSIPPDDTETLIDRSMLLLMLLTQRRSTIFPKIRYQFILPMAKALNIDKDNEAINEHILKSIAAVVLHLQDGKTLTVPDLTEPCGTTLEIGGPHLN